MRILRSTKDMPREEWLELRRQSIGGSDAAAVLGLNKWKSPFTLYFDKMGSLPDAEDNEAMRIGRDLEAYVAERFCEATSKKVRRRNAMFLHDKYSFISANIDREVVGENAGLECKTTNAFAKSDFENGEIPLYYYVQCMHYMAVMGYEKMYLAVLVLGRAFYWFEIERNETEIDNLISAEVEFWKKYIETETPPPVDGTDSTSDTLSKIYPGNTDGEQALYGLEETAKAYIDIGAQIKSLEKMQTEYKNVLLAELKESDTGFMNGYKITNKPSTRTTLDSKALKKDLPEVYEKYSKTSESKRFLVKEEII